MPDPGITKGRFFSDFFVKAFALVVAANQGSARGSTPTEKVAQATTAVKKDIGPICEIYDPKWAALFAEIT